MGSLFSSQTDTTESPYQQNPWKPQEKFLNHGFKQAKRGLNSAQDTLSGMDYTANMNSGQKSAISGISQTGMQDAQNLSAQLGQMGQSISGNTTNFGNNANSLYNRAGQDRTDTILGNATAYSDNPHLQGQIDAALGDVRKAFDGTVGDINSGATASGNINSTRAGVLEAQALDDAMDRSASISASMRGNAYENGLDRAMLQDQQSFQNQMAANANVGASGQMGVDLMNQGLNTSMSGYQNALAANTVTQQHEQSKLDGQRQQVFDMQNLINNYMSQVGGSYGGYGYNTQVTESASPFQQIAGAALGAAGIMKQ